jgi:hypothetical protein
VLAPLRPFTVCGTVVPLSCTLNMFLPRVLGGLLDGGRHFVGLAVADADLALAVAGDDEGRRS